MSEQKAWPAIRQLRWQRYRGALYRGYNVYVYFIFFVKLTISDFVCDITITFGVFREFYQISQGNICREAKISPESKLLKIVCTVFVYINHSYATD